jgi:predicted N-acetyltransferase YhbS
MAVDPACQRQGIGRAIIARILHWIDQRGLPALLDASRLGYPLYASLGFLPVDEAHVYLCAQPPLAVPPPSGVYPLQESDLAELHALDTAAFGGDRRAVLRILQRDFPQGGLLRRDESGRIGGYLIAKGRRIGPWVAHTPQDAEALLLAALTLPLDGPLLTILPGQNHIGPPLLERYGFRLVRSLRHMRRGVVQSPEKRQWIYGQTSFAIG